MKTVTLADKRCPTCGQPISAQALPEPTIKTADELVAAMRRPGTDQKTRDVYRDKDARGYWITSGHERVHSAAIGEALSRKLIEPSFPNIPDGTWSLPERAAECRLAWQAREAARHRR